MDNVLVQHWLVSERKYTTFGQLYESNDLTYEQVLRLKTAMALYEVVPSAIMTPFVFKFLKLMAVRPKNVRQLRFSRIGMTAFVSYATAITVRDAVYWPIVAQVYSEIHKIEKRNMYKL